MPGSDWSRDRERAVWRRVIVALLFCAAAQAAPWTFRADFRHGFSGWMSYPLPQDIGFDPTLIVEDAPGGPVLVRDIANAGERELSAGFIRPLHFLANSATRVRLRYVANWPSAGASLKLVLAGENGRRYEAALPTGGVHELTVSGNELSLPGAAVAIETVVLVGHATQRAVGAKNRIELRDFELNAARTAEVPLQSPGLFADPDRGRVAGKIVDPSAGLELQLSAGASPVRVTLQDSEGRATPVHTVTAPGRHVIPLPTGTRPGLWTARLQSASARTEFSFLVLGNIPAHPRVLLSAERLAELRATPHPLIHEQALALAVKLKDAVAAGAAIAKLPAGQTLRPAFNGELGTYFTTIEGYSNAIAYAALDYALTGDAASLDSARRGLLAMAQWPTWTPPRFAAHGMHTYYETGIAGQRLALAYDLIAAKLSAAEKHEVADAFWTKCIEPTVEEYFSYNRMPTGGSNWMANSLGGAIAAAVAVAGDDPGWREREGVALAQLIAAYERNLHGLFPGHGGEAEPSGYEHFAMEGISWSAAALSSLGIRPHGTDAMLNGFWWPDYAMARPSLVLDTGDFNGEFRTLAGFAFGAEFGGIRALRAFYDRVPRNAAAPNLLDLLCCTAKAETPAPAPLSRIFPNRGSAVLRSGWGPDDAVISLRAGPWFNHEHHDQGSFQVAAFGQRLVAEGGYANYYADPNYAGYFTQAPGHNTVLVDGDAFSQGEYDGPYWKALQKHPAITDHLLGADFDYVAADLAPAYGGRLSGYERQYLFLAPDMLIVRDDLRAPQPHVFTWLLHAAENAEVRANGNGAMISTGDAVVLLAAVTPAVAWEEYAAPSPARISQILGNILVHPADQKPPQRWALRLASPRSTTARFQVTMRFRKRSAGPAAGSDPWAPFRNAPGPLRCYDLTTDGAVFAGRGASWMAIGARSVLRGTQPLFTATTPADAAWSRSASGIDLDLKLDTPAAFAVHVEGLVQDVSVDGRSVRYDQRNGAIQFSSLAKGEHRVRIRTAL